MSTTKGSTADDERRIENPTTMEDWVPTGRFPFLKAMLAGCLFVVIGAVVLMLVVSVEDYARATGLVYPADDIDVCSPVDGVIQEVIVNPGETVSKGQALAVLDSKSLRDRLSMLKLNQAKLEASCQVAEKALARLRLNPLPKELRYTDTELADARAELELAQKQHDRAIRLKAKKVETDASVEKVQTKLEHAKIQLQQAEHTHRIVQSGLAKAIIDEAQARCVELRRGIEALIGEQKTIESEIARYTLRAPEAGVAVALPKRDGEAVDYGELVATIALGPERCIYLRVGEEDFREVGVDQPTRYYSAMFPYRKYGYATGKVLLIRPWARGGEAGRYYEVKATVESTPFPLKLGSSVSAEIVLGRKRLYEFLTD